MAGSKTLCVFKDLRFEAKLTVAATQSRLCAALGVQSKRANAPRVTTSMRLP